MPVAFLEHADDFEDVAVDSNPRAHRIGAITEPCRQRGPQDGDAARGTLVFVSQPAAMSRAQVADTRPRRTGPSHRRSRSLRPESNLKAPRSCGGNAVETGNGR